MSSLIAFVGPSLSAGEAKRLGHPCELWPPARQGDVWRAMQHRPKAIALIDGVFENVPSVWHREILEALSSGIVVFGASSMGALRAAELCPYGMVGVGQIFEAYRRGALWDDGDVALLHAGPEEGFLPLTVPLVNLRHALRCALEQRVLTPREAKALGALAERLFYQERTWPRMLGAVGSVWTPATRVRWDAWASKELPDLKREDARRCIQTAAQFVRTQVPVQPPKIPLPPSMARRRKLSLLARLGQRPLVTSDNPDIAEAGLRRRLLADWARTLGFEAHPIQVSQALAQWLSEKSRKSRLESLGVDDADLFRLGEELVLEKLLLTHSSRLVPDGPSRDEGLAAETILLAMRRSSNLPKLNPAAVKQRRRAGGRLIPRAQLAKLGRRKRP